MAHTISQSQTRSRSAVFSSASINSLLSVCALILLFSVGAAEAFPFGKSSGVTELHPSTFSQFVTTHKPVYILFYAPWCGHCKSIHPEWEKFAKAVDGTIRVGALNADEHKELGGKYGIRGFPTIKYWGVGEKRVDRALDYDGPRSAAAIQAKAMSLIPAGRVKTALTSDALRDAVRASPLKRIAVLFSARKSVPAIYAVLANSPRLQTLPFYFVGGGAKEGLAAEFGVSQLPTVAVLHDTGSDIAALPYTGKQIAYNPLAKFLLSSGMGEAGAEAESVGAAPSQSRPAMPVRPVPLHTETLESFCVPGSTAVGERPPLCVISLTSAFALDEVHALYAHEPLIFFEGRSGRRALTETLRGTKLALADVADAVKDGDDDAFQVLLLRASKSNIVRFRLLDGIKTADDLSSALQKALAGELSLSKKKVS